MTRYRFAPSAAEQMIAIWNFSALRWGKARADRYIKAIEAAVAAAANETALLRRRAEYGAEFHSVRSGRHIVFVRKEADNLLVVVAVLHQMMEPSAYLSDEEG